MRNDLQQLFNKYGADKASKHHYDTVYHEQLQHLRDVEFNLLEIGIFKGDSIRAWVEYFPKATIYGVDTFQRIAPKEIDILEHPRVKWLKSDSTNPSLAVQIEKKWGSDVEFDVIIDDGLHTPEANGKTLTILWPFLAANGIYFVEDVWPIGKMTSTQLNHRWVKQHLEDYNVLKYDFFLRQLRDKQVEEFDLRKLSGEPDSYIFKVTK